MKSIPKLDLCEAEIETERTQAIKNLISEGTSLELLYKQYKNVIAYSEVLHGAYILMSNVESYLVDHPSIIFDKKAYEYANRAFQELFNLYQRLGTLRCETQINDTAML